MDERKVKQAREICFKANKYAQDYKVFMPKLREVLKPYLGRKIKNKDGSVIKELRDKFIFPELAEERFNGYAGSVGAVRSGVLVLVNDFDIYALIKYCYAVPGRLSGDFIGVYYNCHAYIGKIKDGVLTEFYPDSHAPQVINEDEQIKTLVAAQELYNAAIDERDKLYYELRELLNIEYKSG